MSQEDRRSFSWKARNFPEGCHEFGNWEFLALGEALDLSRPVGELPVEIRNSHASPGRAESDMASVRSPHRLPIFAGIERQPGHRVSLPVVNPHVPLRAAPEVERQPPAIRREAKVPVVAGHVPECGRIPFAVHPMDPHVAPRSGARHVDQRSVAREGELSSPSGPVGMNVLQHRNRLAGHSKPLRIERPGVERALVHVDEVAARQIAPMVSASLQDASFAVGKRLRDQTRVFVVPDADVRPPCLPGAPAATGA